MQVSEGYNREYHEYQRENQTAGDRLRNMMKVSDGYDATIEGGRLRVSGEYDEDVGGVQLRVSEEYN